MTTLNRNRSRNKFERLKRAALYSFLTVLVSIPGLIITLSLTGIMISLIETDSRARITLDYDQFIQHVDQNKNNIEIVEVNKSYSEALVIPSNDGPELYVDLPNNPEIVDSLTEKGVDVSVVSSVDASLLPLIAAFSIPVIIVLAGSLLWTWALIDCATYEAREGNTKTVWILTIIFASWIGALMYLLVRRPQRMQELTR